MLTVARPLLWAQWKEISVSVNPVHGAIGRCLGLLTCQYCRQSYQVVHSQHSRAVLSTTCTYSSCVVHVQALVCLCVSECVCVCVCVGGWLQCTNTAHYSVPAPTLWWLGNEICGLYLERTRRNKLMNWEIIDIVAVTKLQLHFDCLGWCMSFSSL